MNNLLINRINLRFNKEINCYLNISKATSFSLVGNKVVWTKGKLSSENLLQFEEWLRRENIDDDAFICFEFSEAEKDDCFSVKLNDTNIQRFKYKLFLQELGGFFLKNGFYIEPFRIAVDFSAYQRISNFDQDWDRFKRIDFKWNGKREELFFNIGSENTLISIQKKQPEESAKIIDGDSHLVYKRRDNNNGPCKIFAGKHIQRDSLQKFNYSKRYRELKNIASEYLYTFSSNFFDLDKSGLKSVKPHDIHAIISRQNLMAFGGGKTAVNAALGMREYGPFRKIKNANKVKLLFIYQNRDDANNLYLYLRNGLKHFPGLLSYTGIPVALPDGDKEERGLTYHTTAELPDKLKKFLLKKYPEATYPETLAIVIGPFKKYESEEESDTYYKVKKLLLDKGISSQFVSDSSIKEPNFHYFLPNIAIAILAKLGGIPWKLDNKRRNELVIGFNTKKLGENTFLGSAVFFDNEGKLGQVKSFPQGGDSNIIKHLKDAIIEYNRNVREPERLVIHYYKPPQKKEIKNIEYLLKDELDLQIPFALVEINDSKSRMDICFDTEYRMGMPESGLYVEVGRDEYLLFNNNRYQKKPVRQIEEVLPVKVKIFFADTGGFHHKELITQVYEFSRLNWKGLKQKSQPVTTTYSKMIADFSSNFEGVIPDNSVAQNTPWFI